MVAALGLALTALQPTVGAAADSAAPAVAAAKTTAPTGPYHAGCLKFTATGNQAVELFIQFRDGRALASHVLVNGKLHSPSGPNGRDDAPNVASDNVEQLRFDGTQLQGDWKWVARAAVETVTFDATVRDGIVTGKAGQAELTGWLRSEEQMAQVNGLAPERNWPSRTGPREDWSGIDTGATLTTDFSRSHLVWFSEAEFGGGRETRRCPLRWLSGSWSPIVGEGRIFFIHQQPAGEVVDEATEKYAAGLLDKLLARDNVLLDPAVRRAKERGAAHFARVDADDVIVCVDGASGKTVWETVLPGRSYRPAPYNKHADQTRTGCYGDGKVFMLGRTFRLYACDAKTGKLLWESALPGTHEGLEAFKQKRLADRKELAMDSLYPPLHFADGVVFAATLGSKAAGGDAAAVFGRNAAQIKEQVVAFDADTGKLLWTTPGSTPGLWRHDGVARVLVTRGGSKPGDSGIACVDLRTGKEAWSAQVEGDAEGPSLQLRLLGSHLVTSHRGKTDAHYLVGYKVEPTGLKQLWKQTDETSYLHDDNPMTMHKGLLYTRLNGAGDAQSTLVAMEPDTGKIVAQADATGGSGRNGPIIVNDGLVIVQLDGSHPSGQAPGNLRVYRLPDLERVGGILQTHNLTSGYDTPMAFQYVDGRLIIRGCNRIACYDLRKSPGQLNAEQAIQAVGADADAVISRLLTLATDADVQIREFAGRELAARVAAGQANSRQAEVLPVLVRLMAEADPKQRRQLALTLGSLGEAALPFLVESFRDPNVLVRIAVVELLGQMGGVEDPRIDKVLLAALDDGDPNLLEATLTSLGKRTANLDLYQPVLVKLIDAAQSPLDREAMGALLRILPNTVPPQPRPKKLESLLVDLLSEDAALAYRAVDAIRALGDDDALRIFISLLEADDPRRGVRVVRGLAAMGARAKPALPALERAMVNWKGTRSFMRSAEPASKTIQEAEE
jgi:outer membrane protein assembly factor BamB